MKEGGALIYVYVLKHIVSLCYRTGWMFTKIGRDEVLMALHVCGLSHLVYLNTISIDFIRLSALSALIMCNFHVYNWENANIKDLNAWRILMKFLCIDLGEGRGMH